jgi:hypothetical protein
MEFTRLQLTALSNAAMRMELDGARKHTASTKGKLITRAKRYAQEARADYRDAARLWSLAGNMQRAKACLDKYHSVGEPEHVDPA